MMAEKTVIYVKITNEAVDVWRPVNAARISEDIYRLPHEKPDEDEEWEFPAGSIVRCIKKTFAGGGTELVACEAADEQLAAPDRPPGGR